MDFLEAHRRFRVIEDRFGLFERHIAGVPIWDYLRWPIWRKIQEETGVIGLLEDKSIAKRSTLGGRLCLANRLFQNIIAMDPRRYKDCDYLFIGAGFRRRKKLENGYFWDLWCDPVIDYLGRDSCVLLEEPFQGRHSRINHTKQVTSTSSIDLPVAFYDMFKCYWPKQVNVREVKFLKELDFAVSEIFEIPSMQILNAVNDLLYRHRVNQPRIRQLFKSLKPKAIFMICSYGGREKYIEAAKDLSIPVIELQHGTISPYHLGYSYPQGTSKLLSPDYFLSFGKYWTDTVEFPIESSHVETMGYPYFDNEFNSFKGRNKESQILFVSQRSIGKKISEFAVKLSHQLPSEWKIVYKLHPKEVTDWEYRYSHLKDTDINVITGEKPSLYDLLSQCAIQVGVFSTALYEGLAFGCRTYLLNLDGVESMKILVDKGICKLINHPSEVDFKVESNVSKPNLCYYFAYDWKKNLDKALIKWSI